LVLFYFIFFVKIFELWVFFCFWVGGGGGMPTFKQPSGKFESNSEPNIMGYRRVMKLVPLERELSV